MSAKYTKGPYTNSVGLIIGHRDVCIAKVGGGTTEDTEANAALIMEAFTVASETNRTPRELATERAELLEALKGCVKYIEADDAARIWAYKWPNACKTCRGAGGYYSPPTYHNPEGEGDICEDCVGQQKCPRCGVDWPDCCDGPENEICPSCNWKATEPDIQPLRGEDRDEGCPDEYTVLGVALAIISKCSAIESAEGDKT